MKTFFQIFLAVILSLILVSMGALFIFSLVLSTSPDIPEQAYLDIGFSGALPDYQAPDPIEEALGKSSLDVKKLRENLEKAAVDKRIKAVIIRPELYTGGFGQLQELFSLIKNFRTKSAKKTIAYLGSDFSFTRDYYLACACDSIIMPPEANLFLTGVRSEVTFYKDFFEKIGVQAQFLQIAEYKNAPDVYTKSHMTPYHKSVLEDITKQYYNDIITTISRARNLKPEQVEQIINHLTGLSGKEALKLGLVDRLAYYSQITQNLKKQNKYIRRVSAKNYAQLPISSLKIRNKSRLAVINCNGIIYSGSESELPFLGKILGAQTIIKDIQRAARSHSIKGILLRIDSPGGSSLPSAAIYHAILEAKKKKPVIATIADLGASGGYYIAMAADTIVANPNSLVGSIGVFAGKFNFKETYQKLGLNVDAVQQGNHADLFSALTPWTKEEKMIIHKIINNFYKDFVQKVANARHKTFNQIEQVARGHVWTGAQAQQIGLIDTLGNFYQALKILKQKAGIPADESVRLVYYPKEKSLMNEIFSTIKMTLFNSHSNFLKQLQKIEKLLDQWQNKPLALLPFQLQFK